MCTFEYFSAEDTASGIKFLHGGLLASWVGNLTFWGTFLPQKPKIGRIGRRARGRGPRWPRIGSACENRGQSALT